MHLSIKSDFHSLYSLAAQNQQVKSACFKEKYLLCQRIINELFENFISWFCFNGLLCLTWSYVHRFAELVFVFISLKTDIHLKFQFQLSVPYMVYFVLIEINVCNPAVCKACFFLLYHIFLVKLLIKP